MPDENEMGWCQPFGGGEAIPSKKEDCEKEAMGTWTKEHPGGICMVVTAALGSTEAGKVDYIRDLRNCMVFKEPAALKLWNTYSPSYYQFGAPIAEELTKDPMLRKLLQTFIIDLVLQALNVNAAVENPSTTDALLRNLVQSGARKFKDNLRSLDPDHGEQLVRTVFDCLKEVSGEVE